MTEPNLIEGGIAVDDRGQLSFINSFSPSRYGIERFYTVSNFQKGFVRAWHGHKYEDKCVTVLRGAAIVAAVEIDNWREPAVDCPIYRYVLSAAKPAMLWIPPGYANGFKTLTDDTLLMFLSTTTVEESINDDYRFPATFWNWVWRIEER